DLFRNTRPLGPVRFENARSFLCRLWAGCRFGLRRFGLRLFQLCQFFRWNISSRSVLATLQRSHVSNNRPSVRHRHVTAVRHHGVFAISNGVENLAIRHFTYPLVLQSGHRVQAILLCDSVAGRGQSMANGTGNVETLLSALHQIGGNGDGNTSAPVRAHLARVVIIRADAETNPCARQFFAERSAARRYPRRRGHLRFWHFVTNRDRTRNRNPRAAAISEKIEWRLCPDFLLPHHIGKNFPWGARAVFSAKTAHRDDDDAGEKEDEKKAAQHFNPPRARW